MEAVAVIAMFIEARELLKRHEMGLVVVNNTLSVVPRGGTTDDAIFSTVDPAQLMIFSAGVEQGWSGKMAFDMAKSADSAV